MPTRRTASLLAFLALTVAGGASLHAQSTAPAKVGERVRITTASQRAPHRIVGSVVGVQGDTLLLRTSDVATPRPVAIGEISTLEVSFGRSGNVRRGLLWGSAVGATLGGIVGAVTYKKPECAGATFFCGGVAPNRSADVVAGAIVGGLAGLAVGGIWGATHLSERWIRRPLGSGARVGIAPGSHGATLTLAARF